MPNAKMDSSLLDKALIFAINAHKDTERRGKGFPYIVHPIEVVSIVATMTKDQELLAAAALHDTVEDTDVTVEDIKREFGDRIAELVASESDEYPEGMSVEESWKIRKQAAIDRLAKASPEVKMIALGDKLSNMRAIYQDYLEIGAKVWEKFHNTNPKEHYWHYYGLANSLKELKHTAAFQEFCSLIDKVFLYTERPFKIDLVDEMNVRVVGDFNRENSAKLERTLKPGQKYLIDFDAVNHINFAGMRTLIRMKDNGYCFSIKNVSKEIANAMYSTGVNLKITITEKPVHIDLNNYVESGDGYTAISYFSKDDDSMMKLYAPFISLNMVENEKRVAYDAFLLGINTPLSGDIIVNNGQYGISFERVMNKKSYARMLSEDPSRCEELAEKFAEVALKLHSTECNTITFPDVKNVYREAAKKFDQFTPEERNKVLKWIDDIPNVTTCVHGDFHYGNTIMTDKGETLIIDMADFSYGDPRFDLGCVYFQSHTGNEDLAQRLYHCDCALLSKFWDHFVKFYFKTEDPEEIKRINQDIEKFAALMIMFYGAKLGTQGFMKPAIDYMLLSRI